MKAAESMEMPMRHFSRSTTTLGGLALVAMLALSSPGVHIVRAADDLAVEAGEGAVCEPDSTRAANDVTDYVQEMQRRQIELKDAPRSDDGMIVLNNRGYNYDNADFAFPRPRELGGR
jgi:hypothetical protein